MTPEETLAKREQILANLGIRRSVYQGREIEFSTGNDRKIELAMIDSEIESNEASASGPLSSTPRQSVSCTYASFNRG
jgi:hypothetical protein